MKATTFILLGLLMVMGGVGGIEHSPDLTTMVQSTCISIVGVIAMWIGTSIINEQNNWGA